MVADCKSTANKDKASHFKRGDAAWRASKGDTTAAPTAPAQATTSKTAAAETTSESGFIHLGAESGDDESTLSRPSYEQYARYEAFLAREEDFQAFGIMGDNDDGCSSIDLEEFIMFEPGLVKPSPSYATVL